VANKSGNFFTSGLLHRSLNLKDKMPTMKEEDCLQQLSSDGMFIKRPLLTGDGVVLIGFNEVECRKILKR